ncbi:ER lumen protein retaining receptor-domain-containing protein [Ochromonadaceae sp. CCMP2298]|nr:ER lumen protein retaining receptor-domain-containing protein [Ochromonadaceae sp. CCMP2298]KAJ1437676.1 ER lumen protein retaining receptor-domain-containing protein [Ochromonadaceae sp. CCMP2298]|mmetsp:Transcript_33526/g.73876  ORF Transcript_33526/g.73876 Transcript_33526/m.73876 type:complete len:295 (+) Transcript_33526:115-999(+)
MKAINLEETRNMLTDAYKTHTKNIGVWVAFLSGSLAVYYFLSSGDFSFLLTYASFMRCFGFGVLNFRVWSTKSVKGVSVKTLQMYFLVFIVRLLSILRHQGYLPFDKTGDWFYHFVEIMSLLSVCLALYAMLGPLMPTYDEKFDRFGNLYIPAEFGIAYLVVPCVLLAVVFHPALNREFFSDTCWTLSMYLEAVAMLPQIFMFQKQASEEGGTVEALIGHTVFALGFARVFELIFWLGSFKELSDHAGSRLPGYIVLISQLGHLLVMADFFFYYFMSISKGQPMELPTAYSGLV